MQRMEIHGHLKWEFILAPYSDLNEYGVSGQLIMQIAEFQRPA